MPKEIVIEVQSLEIRHAPECDFTDQDIEQFVEVLEYYAELFEPAFVAANIEIEAGLSTKVV